jgi:hypothetical protein
MGALRPVLLALRTANRRDRRSLWSFSANNFFVATALLGIAGAFFLFIIGVVLVFPLSSDPLKKIPPERLALWPLSERERLGLQFAALWMNPLMWVLGAVAIFSAVHHRPIVAVAVVLIPASGAIVSRVHEGADRGLWKFMPSFPGVVGQLVRKDLRAILSTLDFWTALALSVSCTFYRLFVRALPDDALMVFSILVVLALSSWSQSCFGLDGAAGLMRYRLMPLRGWQIFLAKEIAFLLVVTLLTLPLSLPVAWAAALMALGLGNEASRRLRPQQRWRFSSGPSALNSLLQIVLLVTAGVAAYRLSPAVLIPCFLVFSASTYKCGRKMFG